MNRLALIGALVLAPVARADPWEKPTKAEIALALTAQALILADTAQTYFALKSPTVREANPFLGSRPSPVRLFGTVALASAALGVTWYALPSPWRNVLSMLTITAEGYTVTTNFIGAW